jgi:hypothetical protein
MTSLFDTNVGEREAESKYLVNGRANLNLRDRSWPSLRDQMRSSVETLSTPLTGKRDGVTLDRACAFPVAAHAQELE